MNTEIVSLFKRQERHPWSSCHHCSRERHVSIVPQHDQKYHGDNVPQLKVLASFQGQLGLGLALDTLQPQHDLLRCLRLLVEDGLGLTSVARLFAIITTLSLGEQRGLEVVS